MVNYNAPALNSARGNVLKSNYAIQWDNIILEIRRTMIKKYQDMILKDLLNLLFYQKLYTFLFVTFKKVL